MTNAPRPLLHRLFGHWAFRTLAVSALLVAFAGPAAADNDAPAGSTPAADGDKPAPSEDPLDGANVHTDSLGQDAKGKKGRKPAPPAPKRGTPKHS